MNIFRFESKAILKSTMIWSFVLYLVLLTFMIGIYPIFSQGVESVLKMMENMPLALRAMFGIGAANFLTFSGYFTFIHEYILLIGAIMAMVLSLTVFSREKKAKCMDFLMTKPQSRPWIFMSKLGAILANIFAMNLCYVIMVLLLFRSHEVKAPILGLALALFLTQLEFVTLGVVLSVFMKKIRSISGLATGIGFGAFILSALENLIQEKWMAFIAPLHFFYPGDLLIDGHYQYGTMVWACVLILAGLIVSYLAYVKKDVHGV